MESRSKVLNHPLSDKPLINRWCQPWLPGLEPAALPLQPKKHTAIPAEDKGAPPSELSSKSKRIKGEPQATEKHLLPARQY